MTISFQILNIQQARTINSTRKAPLSVRFMRLSSASDALKVHYTKLSAAVPRNYKVFQGKSGFVLDSAQKSQKRSSRTKMSDVELLSPTSPHRLDEAEMEHEQHEPAAGEDEPNPPEEQDDAEKQGSERGEEEEENRPLPAEEDRTEDQVPDITGTENADVMATSLDGIEELPASEETQEVESTELLDASPKAVEETDLEKNKEESDVAPEEVEAGVVEDGRETSVPEEAPQEVNVESAPELAEEGMKAETTPADKEEELPGAEPELEAEVEAAEEIEEETETKPAEETEDRGEIYEEVKTEFLEESAEPEETQAESEVVPVASYEEQQGDGAAEEPASDAGAFELQAPPTPKRPRTPNELDNLALSNEEVTEEVVEEQDVHKDIPVEVQEAQPDEVISKTEASVPETAAPGRDAYESPQATPTRGSIPSTPKSTGSRATEQSVTTPRKAGATPSPRTPMTKDVANKTPTSGTPRPKKAFDFEQPLVETPKTPKSATFDESVSTPKTPKSAKTPKTPSTPKSPRVPETETIGAEEPSQPPAEYEPQQEEISQHDEEATEGAESVPEVEAVSEAAEFTEAVPKTEEESAPEEREVEAAQQPEEPVPSSEEQQEVAEVEIASVGTPAVGSATEELPMDEHKEDVHERGAVTPTEESRRAIPQHVSPPPRPRRERSPSPVHRKPAAVPRETSFVHYDQDTFRTKGAPPRLPTYASFSSYTPVEKPTYSALSPWVQSATGKYRSEYSSIGSYRSPSLYLSMFDELVSTGPFSSSLYSTNRLLERSRSRTRERKNAMRSARSASNYYRYTSTYAAAPVRTRDYSTPPSSAVTRPPSRASSFISFIEYSGAKQYELARSRSRSYGFESPYSRSGHVFYSRAQVSSRFTKQDACRESTVMCVKWIDDMNRGYPAHMPSTTRRPDPTYLTHTLPWTDIRLAYGAPSYMTKDSSQFDKQSIYDTGVSVRGMYEHANDDGGKSKHAFRMRATGVCTIIRERPWKPPALAPKVPARVYQRAQRESVTWSGVCRAKDLQGTGKEVHVLFSQGLCDNIFDTEESVMMCTLLSIEPNVWAAETNFTLYPSLRSPSSNTLGRLYSHFARNWVGV
uniref:Uncharacterized protein n=1 Tax=Ascaris lumbricoides TaxID=6252 RepID=A0A9J2NZV6_ASCLU